MTHVSPTRKSLVLLSREYWPIRQARIGLCLAVLPLLAALSACRPVGRIPASGSTLEAAQPTIAMQGQATASVTQLTIGTLQPLTASATPLLPAPTTASPPTASPTPAATLRQLTEGGCCVNPFWFPDGQRVLFLDRPSSDAPAGLWSVGPEGGQPQLFTQRLGLYSSQMDLLAFLEGQQTKVERLSDGQVWTIANGGRSVNFSPDGQQIVWTAGQSGPPFDTARREIWISQVDGSQPRQILTLTNGGFSGWFPDGRLLISGQLDPPQAGQALWVFDPKDGAMIEIARGSRLRNASVSPNGEWLAYQIVFAEDAAENGLWLASIQSGQRFRLDLFGAYRWRDTSRLLVIPLDTTRLIHQIWQVDGTTGESQPLTDPLVTPFKVANGDWAVSPDGSQIVFVSADDHNLWLLGLPGE